MAILNGLPQSDTNVFYGTLGTDWTDNGNGTHSQTVLFSGSSITENSVFQVFNRYVGDGSSQGYVDHVEQDTQFLTYVTNGICEPVSGGVKFTVFDAVSTVDIPIIVILVK